MPVFPKFSTLSIAAGFLQISRRFGIATVTESIKDSLSQLMAGRAALRGQASHKDHYVSSRLFDFVYELRRLQRSLRLIS